MKYSEMISLMGKRVIVTSEYKRKTKTDTDIINGQKKIWEKCTFCNQWEGWIVGFRWKQDGIVDFWGDYTTFRETGRKLCVLVIKHPTELPKYIPLDGYCLKEEEENEKT